MQPSTEPRREKVDKELARYEHPLVYFSTEGTSWGVRLVINLREGFGVEHHHEISLHERDIEKRQLAWAFQKLPYDCRHDFIVEMFEKNPQIREQGTGCGRPIKAAPCPL